MLSFTAIMETHLAGQKFDAGEHEIESPSDELRRHAASAAAAGVLIDVDGHDDAHVQSQEDGEAAYAEAVESGDWAEGNLAQFEIDQAAKAAPLEVVPEGDDA